MDILRVRMLVVSIHAPRVGCDLDLVCRMLGVKVSIHAPRVGCDYARQRLQRYGYVSIHAPRVGCDAALSSGQLWQIKFQFTHPVWGATGCRLAVGARAGFNSRTPCGVRPDSLGVDLWFFIVSIHAPRVGCDLRRTRGIAVFRVSIHAPRVGCDLAAAPSGSGQRRFNSRTPCGVRLKPSV